MRNLIILLALTVLLAGCYNQRKAVDQMTRGIDQYGDTARKIFRDKYPCITTTYDSSKFLGSIKDLEFILWRKNDSLRKTAQRLQAVRDSVRQVLTGDDCPQLLGQATDYIAALNVENQDLKEDIAEFKKRVPLIKPVIQMVEDSSKIKDAYQARDREAAARVKAEAERDHYKQLWEEEQARNKGKLVLRVPWWLLVLAAVGGAAIWKRKSILSLIK